MNYIHQIIESAKKKAKNDPAEFLIVGIAFAALLGLLSSAIFNTSVY